MAYKCIGKEWASEIKDFIHSFVLDSDSDVSRLPKCHPGSTAIVAGEGGNVYMVNASGEWRAL